MANIKVCSLSLVHDINIITTFVNAAYKQHCVKLKEGALKTKILHGPKFYHGGLYYERFCKIILFM